LRNELRLVDGLYVELARQLGLRLITTDQRLALSTPMVEAIS
jgi:predicted nucleic acid-binding protein